MVALGLVSGSGAWAFDGKIPQGVDSDAAQQSRSATAASQDGSTQQAPQAGSLRAMIARGQGARVTITGHDKDAKPLMHRFLGGMHKVDPLPTVQINGVVVDSARGIVVTTASELENLHEVTDLAVVGTTLTARWQGMLEVAAIDELLDIALLRVAVATEPDDPPLLALGDSDALEVGDWVMSISNPRLGSHQQTSLANSASVGLISGTKRYVALDDFASQSRSHRYADLLQTSGLILAGSRGGPLFNAAGELVGIMITGHLSSNIGFALPINAIKSLILAVQQNIDDKAHGGAADSPATR